MSWIREQFRDARSDLSGLNPLAALGVLVVGVFLYWYLPSKTEGYAVGTTAALFIAFVAYPWQKERDRRLKVSEENRIQCFRFVEKCLEAREKLVRAKNSLKHSKENELRIEDLGDALKPFGRLYSLIEDQLMMLLLSSQKEALVAAQEIRDSLLETANKMEEFEEMLGQHKSNIPKDVVKNATVDFLEKLLVRFDQNLTEFIIQTRKLEFRLEAVEVSFVAGPTSSRSNETEKSEGT